MYGGKEGDVMSVSVKPWSENIVSTVVVGDIEGLLFSLARSTHILRNSGGISMEVEVTGRREGEMENEGGYEKMVAFKAEDLLVNK